MLTWKWWVCSRSQCCYFFHQFPAIEIGFFTIVLKEFMSKIFFFKYNLKILMYSIKFITIFVIFLERNKTWHKVNFWKVWKHCDVCEQEMLRCRASADCRARRSGVHKNGQNNDRFGQISKIFESWIRFQLDNFIQKYFHKSFKTLKN